jgi:hypothetical protein
MKIKKYVVGAVMAVAVAVSCSPDPSLYPLPYDDRATGSYLRAYQIRSNVWELTNLTGSSFTAIYESVDKNFGADLDKIEFYATHRGAATGRITDEVLVKTFDAAAIASAFAKVAEPTYSDYLRSVPLTVTHDETVAQLATLTTDPDGTTCTGIFPDVCTMVAYPGSLAAGDRIIFRIAITDKQGRVFTVANPQTTVTPALGNPNEANITPNLTGGLFYNSPMLFTMTVVRTLAPAVVTPLANAYVGTYKMTQVARWQPDHSASQHVSFPQGWMDEFVFGSSATDSTQTVTLATVTNGAPTERQFTCTYRGQTITMVINLENTATGLSAAAVTTLNTPLHGPGLPAATAFGLGFPAATSTANLGTVFVPLMNTTVDCTSSREFYMVTPLGGAFAGTTALSWTSGHPRTTVPNRGAFRNDRDGLTVGDRFLIGVDDDADEYGRRNGYCNWYTRVLLTMEKL